MHSSVQGSAPSRARRSAATWTTRKPACASACAMPA
jgi:hypothetical protein